VRVRCGQELILGFADLLKRPLAEKAPERFKMASAQKRAPSPQEIAEELDLDAEKDIALVRTLLDEEWNIYCNNKGKYPSDSLELLPTAILTLHFYDAPAYRELSHQGAWNMEDVRRLLAFPTDWEQRWARIGSSASLWGGVATAFGLEEVAFVFIARVRCHIHSNNLAHIGCTVTDCPGLFASAWDTSVAVDAMYNADGLWYLIDGSKQVDEATLDMIRFICERGWKEKLFFSLNLKEKSKKIILDLILPADKAILGNNGIEVELRLYHAALALRSVQARASLPGSPGLDDQTRKVILKDAGDSGCDSSSVENALLSMIQEHLQVLKVPARKDVVEFNERAVSVAEEEAQLESILTAIFQYAIAKKAYSVLVHNGADKVIAALAELEGRLQESESAATKNRDKFEAEAHDAQAKLDNFVKESRIEIDENLRSILVTPLANDLFNGVIADSVDEVAERSAKRIYEHVLSFWPVIKAVFSDQEKTRIDEACAEVIADEFDNSLKARLIKWLESIKQGTNTAYTKTVAGHVKRINDRLHRRWQELDGHVWLRNIQLPAVTGNRLLDKELLIDLAKPGDLEAPSLVNVIDVHLVTQAVLAITGMILLLAHIPVVGWIVLAGGIVYATLKQFFGQPLGTEVIHKLKEKLAVTIRDGLFKDRQKIMDGFDSKKGLEMYAADFRDQYVNVFEKELEQLRKKFEDAVAAARSTFDKSESERLRIAKDAQECRQTRIAPIRREVQQFRDEVMPLVKTSSEISTA
jgi:hypothetical protein